MSLTHAQTMSDKNKEAHQRNARLSHGPSTPEGRLRSALANLRHGFYCDSRREVLLALGEDPDQYRALMAALNDDLRPRSALEFLLVSEMGEALWKMQRARRMQEGKARKNIQRREPLEFLTAHQICSVSSAKTAPYINLLFVMGKEEGPTPEQIEAFVRQTQADASPELKQFVDHLRPLSQPMEKRQRQKALPAVMAELRELLRPYAIAHSDSLKREAEVDSPEGLASLMVPQGKYEEANFLLRMEEGSQRRFERFFRMLKQVRQGELEPHEENADRSGDVYENTWGEDAMAEDEADDLSEDSEEAEANDPTPDPSDEEPAASDAAVPPASGPEAGLTAAGIESPEAGDKEIPSVPPQRQAEQEAMAGADENADRSGYVYENTLQDNKLPETVADNSPAVAAQ